MTDGYKKSTTNTSERVSKRISRINYKIYFYVNDAAKTVVENI